MRDGQCVTASAMSLRFFSHISHDAATAIAPAAFSTRLDIVAFNDGASIAHWCSRTIVHSQLDMVAILELRMHTCHVMD